MFCLGDFIYLNLIMKIFAFSTPLFMAAFFSQANSVRLTTEITTQWIGSGPIMEDGGWLGLSYHGKGSSHMVYEYSGRKIVTPSWDTYSIHGFCSNASYEGGFRDGDKWQCRGHYNEERLA